MLPSLHLLQLPLLLQLLPSLQLRQLSMMLQLLLPQPLRRIHRYRFVHCTLSQKSGGPP
jgi:hypothetical protein